MQQSDTYSEFAVTVLGVAQTDDPQLRAFVVLPKAASDKLPRRGRTSVSGHINGVAFQATLEPDGQLSHWLALSEDLLQAAGAAIGNEASFDMIALQQEPEPAVLHRHPNTAGVLVDRHHRGIQHHGGHHHR